MVAARCCRLHRLLLPPLPFCVLTLLPPLQVRECGAAIAACGVVPQKDVPLAPGEDAGGLHVLTALMRSKAVEVRREAGRAVANMTADPSLHEPLARAGGLLLLVSFLSSPDPACLRFAAAALHNLALHPPTRPRLLELGCVQHAAGLLRQVSAPGGRGRDNGG